MLERAGGVSRVGSVLFLLGSLVVLSFLLLPQEASATVSWWASTAVPADADREPAAPVDAPPPPAPPPPPPLQPTILVRLIYDMKVFPSLGEFFHLMGGFFVAGSFFCLFLPALRNNPKFVVTDTTPRAIAPAKRFSPREDEQQGTASSASPLRPKLLGAPLSTSRSVIWAPTEPPPPTRPAPAGDAHRDAGRPSVLLNVSGGSGTASGSDVESTERSGSEDAERTERLFLPLSSQSFEC